ncbi:hypothetical protein NPIL_494631 [Nephila pilipes]|uniref:Uncharacterized protein n=1 Tax=Nephila pilipes TaxID=299642 RepID=A0A8X6T7A7_NEPPI|nr:hypothetical protein NPIL_494631 [Nephila pilipes]
MIVVQEVEYQIRITCSSTWKLKSSFLQCVKFKMNNLIMNLECWKIILLQVCTETKLISKSPKAIMELDYISDQADSSRRKGGSADIPQSTHWLSVNPPLSTTLNNQSASFSHNNHQSTAFSHTLSRFPKQW